MGRVIAYTCDRCPLAFEVGDYAYWSLNGHCVKTVCGGCGTMHRLETDRSHCQVWALPCPVKLLPWVTKESAWGDGSLTQDYEWPFAESDWQMMDELPAGTKLDQIACGRCKVVGLLATLNQIEVIGGELCPICGDPLFGVYFDTVN